MIYSVQVLRIYGFKKLHNPIVYTLDGKLIGGIDGFRVLADTEFGLSTLISNTITPTVNMALKNKLKTA